jgi:hypothetical protein
MVGLTANWKVRLRLSNPQPTGVTLVISTTALCAKIMIGIGQNECLRTVAAQASASPTWSDYAQYCRDREGGLRRRAFQHLEKFLEGAKAWSFDDRSAFANWVCVRIAEFGESDSCGLVPQPLAEQLVVPTLREWVARETRNSIPCRWLGMFFSGVVYPGLRAGLSTGAVDAYSLLREALRRNPNDDLARVRLIEMIVGDAEFSCHHLPHYYIGEPKDDVARIAEAVELLPGVVDPTQNARLQSELHHVSQLIDDWMRFTDAGASDFNQWCVNLGRKYRWIKAYYYSANGT